MGDLRFDAHLERVARAPDRAAAIRGMSDEEIVQALAAASKGADAYLANVLATEVMNRMRRAAELRLALETSEARYRALFNVVQEPIVAADMERRITECNRAFERLLGYERGELRGAPTRQLYASDADWEETGRIIQEDLAAGREGRPLVRRLRARSGEVLTVEMRGFYVRDPGGNPVGIVAVVHAGSRPPG
ncbi:MAG TPA: PAS domain S-box protein [Candidatus Thermoplasmatota archaeon]|nr:PAS domain S-box protein [Candidatus Thermoplasmatota archaeon]